MKRIVKKKIKVVANKDPCQFQDEVNRLMDDLAYLKPSVEYDISTDTYKALFQYEEIEETPETAQEECSRQGFDFRCENCPRFQPELNNDGSIRRTAKRGSCFLKGYTCRDFAVCEWFCREFLGNGISPLKGGCYETNDTTDC